MVALTQNSSVVSTFLLNPSCTWADVSLILFANPESSESFTSGFTSRGDAPTPMLKYFLSCFPAANVHCLHEWYSTNALIADIPATDNGDLVMVAAPWWP